MGLPYACVSHMHACVIHGRPRHGVTTCAIGLWSGCVRRGNLMHEWAGSVRGETHAGVGRGQLGVLEDLQQRRRMDENSMHGCVRVMLALYAMHACHAHRPCTFCILQPPCMHAMHVTPARHACCSRHECVRAMQVALAHHACRTRHACMPCTSLTRLHAWHVQHA
eukprot:351085-Chlamydomonas_euryale.AAC.2